MQLILLNTGLLLLAILLAVTEGIPFTRFCPTGANSRCAMNSGSSPMIKEGRNNGMHARFVMKSGRNFKICHSGTDNSGNVFHTNVDVAQALCRQFARGDALGHGMPTISAGDQIPLPDCAPDLGCDEEEDEYDYSNYGSETEAPDANRCNECLNKDQKKKNKLLKMTCVPYAPGFQDCSVEILTSGTCRELMVSCYNPHCWKQENVIKDPRLASEGYGQRCNAASGCTRSCYRCDTSTMDAQNCWPQNTLTGNIYWEPHFTTFDGLHYNFQGQCSYTLIRTQYTEITGEYEKCGKQDVTCLKSLTIVTGVQHKTTLKLGPKRNFMIQRDGEVIKDAQKPYCDEYLCFYDASGSFDAVDLWVGIKILWDRKAEVSYRISTLNAGLLSGLLGNYNGDPSDDLMKPDGTQAKSNEEFGESWMVKGSCSDGASPKGNAPFITKMEMFKAASHCNVIKSSMFAKCNQTEMKENAFHDCIMDVATCSQSNLSMCLCPSVEEIADVCSNSGFLVEGWEKHAPECMPKTCPEGQEFQMCADPCEASCEVKNHDRIPCMSTCIEGCNCPPGQSKDKEGKCILSSDCPL